MYESIHIAARKETAELSLSLSVNNAYADPQALLAHEISPAAKMGGKTDDPEERAKDVECYASTEDIRDARLAGGGTSSAAEREERESTLGSTNLTKDIECYASTECIHTDRLANGKGEAERSPGTSRSTNLVKDIEYYASAECIRTAHLGEACLTREVARLRGYRVNSMPLAINGLMKDVRFHSSADDIRRSDRAGGREGGDTDSVFVTQTEGIEFYMTAESVHHDRLTSSPNPAYGVIRAKEETADDQREERPPGENTDQIYINVTPAESSITPAHEATSSTVDGKENAELELHEDANEVGKDEELYVNITTGRASTTPAHEATSIGPEDNLSENMQLNKECHLVGGDEEIYVNADNHTVNNAAITPNPVYVPTTNDIATLFEHAQFPTTAKLCTDPGCIPKSTSSSLTHDQPALREVMKATPPAIEDELYSNACYGKTEYVVAGQDEDNYDYISTDDLSSPLTHDQPALRVEDQVMKTTPPAIEDELYNNACYGKTDYVVAGQDEDNYDYISTEDLSSPLTHDQPALRVKDQVMKTTPLTIEDELYSNACYGKTDYVVAGQDEDHYDYICADNL